MAKFFNWIKSASAKLLADPNREQRLKDQLGGLEQHLFHDTQNFDLQRLSAAYGIFPEDLGPIVDAIFRNAAIRVWKDQLVTDRERRALQRIATLLDLPVTKQREIEFSIGLDIFEAALATATQDGKLDDDDVARLNGVAASLGTTTRDLLLNHFAKEGEAIVRGMFAGIAEDGTIDEAEWGRFVHAASLLGLSRDDVTSIVRAQTQPYVEHVLADAKSDGRITPQEKQRLVWLLANLALPPSFQNYVIREVARLELLTEIGSGRLPSIQAGDAGLRAGEIAHFRGPATYYAVRQLRSGPRYEQFQGEALITDTRFIFTSALKTLEVNHRRVVSLDRASRGIELRCSSKGSGVYYFHGQDDIAGGILRVAVGRANQTLLAPQGEFLTRHIPRDVRQRVWQRYSGRCAECGDTQYLEFDHVIPYAKGGSNTENNVQLLCRGCNSKKSDMI